MKLVPWNEKIKPLQTEASEIRTELRDLNVDRRLKNIPREALRDIEQHLSSELKRIQDEIYWLSVTKAISIEDDV